MLFEDDAVLFVFFERKVGFGREHCIDWRQLLGDEIGDLAQVAAFHFYQQVKGT
ncbi:hypothetical protein D3C71_2057400 [compost metagenome]